MKSAKKSVLVIEDNELTREILVSILEEDYCVLEAENGQEGLHMVETNQDRLSAILLDLHMPVMDGFSFLKNAGEYVNKIPVIVLTANRIAEDEAKCYELGAFDFMNKPIHGKILERRLQSAIRLKETSSFLEAVETDEESGLLTRDVFFKRMEEFLRNSGNADFDIMVTELGNLRLLKNIYGEKLYNGLVKVIAAYIRKRVGTDGMAARIDEDRVALLLPHCEGGIDGQSVEANIQRLFKNTEIRNIMTFVGIYNKVDRSLPASEIVDRAIIALEMVKSDGSRNYAYYDGPMVLKKKYEQQLEESFQEALENHRFEVWYQPKYEASEGRIAGAEALCRWRDEQGKMISPGVFIPIFESDGLIYRLDEYMYREVCRQQKKWQQEGKKLFPISVNLSRMTMYHSNLLERYRNIIKEYGISADLVPIEITESAATSDEIVKKLANELYQAGFTLQLDDYGSGYSSMAVVNEIHFDTLKLDKSLIDYIGNESGDLLIKHTIEFAHELGIKTVAEGVESYPQLNFLKNMNCDLIQGYYYSPPVPLEKFEKLVEEQYVSDYDRRKPFVTMKRKQIREVFSNLALDDQAIENVVGPMALYQVNDGQVEVRGANQNFLNIFHISEDVMEPADKRDVMVRVFPEDRESFLQCFEMAEQNGPHGAEVKCRFHDELRNYVMIVRVYFLHCVPDGKLFYASMSEI